MQNIQSLLQQIQALPPDRIAEIEDFVVVIAARAAAVASTPSFAAILYNPDDDAYNEL
jgi:hypothetical protein